MASFADQLEAFARVGKERMDTVFRKVVIDIAKSVITESPVDTGRFRGNWMLGVGDMNSAVDWDIRDLTGDGTIQRIMAQVGAEVSAGKIAYITNSLPYAIPLEYGHSSQAPQGMVRLTVAAWEDFLGDAISTTRNLKPL
jgi:hypothetical protein